MPSPIVAPSILSADFGRLAEEVAAVSEQGADWIHVDVMDGRFVPPITIGPGVTRAVRKATHLPVDVHLMVVEPEKHIASFRDAGADRITVHGEACPHMHRVLDMIRESGAQAGIALNPGSSLSLVEEVLDACDLVLVMTVNPGWGGQAMIPACLDKLERLRGVIETIEKPPLIQVDGGVKGANAHRFADADVLVAGSAVFKSDSYADAIATIRGAWTEARVG
jgi:ribulose-phosphate 3-epimerase